MADFEENSITVATINADHSNRHPDVNTVDLLVEKLEDIVRNDLKADIVTVQELGATSSRQLSETLDESHFCTIRTKLAYDHLAISYRSDIWDLPANGIIESKPGKYIALKLINKFDKSEGLVVATHQPYKKKTAVAEAERLVAKFLDEARDLYGYDYVLVAGDMNKEPPVVQTWLPDFNRVISNGSPKTTKSGRKDNIVYDDSLSEESGWVWNYPQFTHRPVVATFKLDE